MVQPVQKIMNDILPFLKDSKYLFLRLHGIQKILWSKLLEELVVLKLFSMLSASILLPLLFSGRLVKTSTNRSTQVALQHLYPREHSQKRQIRSSGTIHRTFVSQKFRSAFCFETLTLLLFQKIPPHFGPCNTLGQKDALRRSISCALTVL